MHIVDKHIAGGYSTAEAITEASLSRISTDLYDSTEIRLEAALLLESYTGQSGSRLRRSTTSESRTGQQKRQRLLTKERQNPMPEADVIDLV